MRAAKNETPKNVATQKYEHLSKSNEEVTRVEAIKPSASLNQTTTDEPQFVRMPIGKPKEIFEAASEATASKNAATQQHERSTRSNA